MSILIRVAPDAVRDPAVTMSKSGPMVPIWYGKASEFDTSGLY